MGGKSKFYCNECCERFAGNVSFVRHIEMNHGDEKDVQIDNQNMLGSVNTTFYQLLLYMI